MHPDGEVSVDSLSPAHTLSSVPSPASVEALSPYSLQVSHCLQRFCPYQFLEFDWYFHCKSLVLVVFTYCMCSSWCTVGLNLYPDGVQTLTAALCFWMKTHASTPETFISKSLKHLVKLIICCLSEMCPAPSSNRRC